MNKTGEVWIAQIKCFKMGSISALSNKNLIGVVRKAQIMCFKMGSISAFSDKWFRSYAFLKVGCLAKNSFKNHGS